MAGFQQYSRAKAGLESWSVAIVLLLASITAARAEYRLNVDDVVEIAVAGIPDLKQRVTVQADGTISFPLIGSLAVRGLTPSELLSKVQAALATKIFRERTGDGRETTFVVEPTQVTAAVVEFRPIFIDGDVSKPGQLPFHPFMTVRQAVALAGGYDLMRFRMSTNPFLESADLQSEYDAAWTEFIKEQAHVWRLKTELGEKAELDQGLLSKAPIRQTTVAELVSTAARELEARRADQQREKDFLQSSIKQTTAQIGILTEQEQKEAQGEQADVAELQKVTELFARGSLPSPRVVDARRAVLLSATRKLQTETQLSQAQKLRLELGRQLERADDQRKIDLLQELQEANVKVAGLAAKLRSVEEKLHYTGIVRSQLARGKGAKPDIAIIRRTDQGHQRMAADEDFELSPGDIVEVALHDPLPEVPKP